MPARDFPNLGLRGGFAEHESGWADDMNANLLKLSALAQATVISKESATPSSPANGDVYLFDEDHPTQANAVAIWEGETGSEAWTYVTPAEGWLVYNQDEGYFEKFDGTVWAELATGGGGGGGIPDAPSDGSLYGRKDAAWEVITGGGGGSSIFGVFDATTQTVLKQSGCTITFPGGSGGTHYSVAFDTPRADANYAVLFGGIDQGSQFGDSGYVVDGTVTTAGFDIVAHSNGLSERQVKRLSFLVVDENTGGGGGATLGAMLEQVQMEVAMNAVVMAPDSGYDFVIDNGNLVAIYYSRYAVGTGFVGAVTSYTVPAGKVAYLIAAYPTKNTRNDPSFYKHRLYNEDTSVVITEASGYLISENGQITADTNTTVSSSFDPRVLVGEAGEEIRAYAAGGSDSISRSVTCFYILVVVDA